MDEPNSPFNASQSVGFTDTTVYPAPNTTGLKRQRLEDDQKPFQETSPRSLESSSNARYYEHVKGNHVISQVIYKRLKQECDELATLTVSLRGFTLIKFSNICAILGHGQDLGDIDHAEVSFLLFCALARLTHIQNRGVSVLQFPSIEDT